jgi:pimeloyl-ACP methyl ester carboxylesterase
VEEHREYAQRERDPREDEPGLSCPVGERPFGHWVNPTPEGRSQMVANVSEEGFRDEFVGELPGHLVERVSPDLWKLHWSLMQHPPRPGIVVGIFEDQANTLADFPRMQAYLRDLPDAELHLLDGGHWALETNLDEVVALVRDFLDREHSGR